MVADIKPPVKGRKPPNNNRKSVGPTRKAKDKTPRLKLNNGLGMPKGGFAVWKSADQAPRYSMKGPNYQSVDRIVEFALENEIRHIDCAQRYENLDEVGLGISSFLDKQSKLGQTQSKNIKDRMNSKPVLREDLWISVKLWSCFNENVEAGFEKILSDLKLDYVDTLYLHFPCALKHVVKGKNRFTSLIEFVYTKFKSLDENFFAL